jgi:hypothetical protein
MESSSVGELIPFRHFMERRTTATELRTRLGMEGKTPDQIAEGVQPAYTTITGSKV